jgi:hypothetical protein
MGTYFFAANLTNMSELEVNNYLTSLLVSLRFSIMTIFLVGLAKWFSRSKLSLFFVSSQYIFILKIKGSLVDK